MSNQNKKSKLKINLKKKKDEQNKAPVDFTVYKHNKCPGLG